MKVLWFEITEPSSYKQGGMPIAGWQDALEKIVRESPEIQLGVSFVCSEEKGNKNVNGVNYYPISVKYGRIERKLYNKWDLYVKKVLPRAKEIVDEFKPDIIHVFGIEWPLGQVAKYTDVPVVIHIQGSVVPYNNAFYPPNYSIYDYIIKKIYNPYSLYILWKNQRNNKNWEQWERDTWKNVKYYMGRTDWDRALANVMHPNCCYFHVEEALRGDFINREINRKKQDGGKLRLVSTGCSTFWKGPDMLLKTASILKDMGIDFEWNVAGAMPVDLREIVEKKEGFKYRDCNINVLGFINASSLKELLLSSTMYVQTSYIENSPNGICEAQCLGVPVVSTNVGGISTLVHHNEDGVLVPANDPWQMANAIVELYRDDARQELFSKNAREKAQKRHNPKNILSQLMDCYKKVIELG